MKRQNIRDLELSRTPGRNIKALRDYFISHDIEHDDAIQLAIRVYDLVGLNIDQTPTAFVHRIAEEQESFFREFHV